jgi:hypothetical protein
VRLIRPPQDSRASCRKRMAALRELTVHPAAPPGRVKRLIPPGKADGISSSPSRPASAFLPTFVRPHLLQRLPGAAFALEPGTAAAITSGNRIWTWTAQLHQNPPAAIVSASQSSTGSSRALRPSSPCRRCSRWTLLSPAPW